MHIIQLIKQFFNKSESKDSATSEEDDAWAGVDEKIDEHVEELLDSDDNNSDSDDDE